MSSCLSGVVVVVKNTFLDFEEESPESPTEARRERRLKTLPHGFKSVEDIVQGVSGEEESTCSEGDTEVSVSSESSVRYQALTGRVWSLSQDPQGCREVQEALGDASLSHERREAIARELSGHILAAAVCPHANHVLQKCSSALRPAALQFIVEEIPTEAVSMLAQSKFGCRVLQRLFEHCHSFQVRGLVEAVLENLLAIAQSPYGNYVVQNLLDCGAADAEQRRHLSRTLEGSVGALGAQPFGCIVISAALTKCDPESRTAIARAVLQEPGLLSNMARTRHGHRTVLVLLGAVAGHDLEKALGLLRADAKVLLANKFGRAVAARFEQPL